jgi:hypothetical protein
MDRIRLKKARDTKNVKLYQLQQNQQTWWWWVNNQTAWVLKSWMNQNSTLQDVQM